MAIALRAARDGANIVIAAKTDTPHPRLPGTIHTAAAEIEATSPPANWSFERRVEYVRWARQVVGRYSQLDGRLAAEFQQASAELQEWEKSGGTNDFF